jgi:uncharacterized membrane protein
MFEWFRPYSGWTYLWLGLALLAVVVLARAWAISPRLKSLWLFLPRLAVFGVLLLILSNPVQRSELQLPSQPASVVYLVDCSRSMALDEPISRLDRARQMIQSVDSAVAGNERPRFQLFRFGRDLASAADVAQLHPVEEASNLAHALENLPGRFLDELPRALFVFSDGTFEKSYSAAKLADIYRRLGLPVHVVPLGDTRVRGDVAIQDLIVPRQADANVKVPIRVTLRSQGFEGQRVQVQILAADRRPQVPLVSLPVTLSGDTQPVELVLESNPDLGELLLHVPVLDGEVISSNNQVPFRLAARSRKIRVLYMEGTMSNEYQWVHNALVEDKDIECLSMIVDQQYVERPRLMRVNDPYKGFPATREELLEYDCVICSDISLGAFTREQLEWTVELVAKRGGGFAMVGGITSFGAGGWDQTAWDKLIPVDMSGGALGRGWLYHNFRAVVPQEAQTHPIWRILEDPDENRKALNQIPLFTGTNYIQRLKPAATVLAVSRESIPGINAPMTVMACESYGRGRTFAMAPDTTADWGKYFESQWGVQDNRYFRKFWRNVVRWLVENSVGGRRLVVETDRLIYRPGQTVEITAQAFDNELHETIDYHLTAQLVPEGQEAGSTSNVSALLIPNSGALSYAGQISAVVPMSGVTDRQLAGLLPLRPGSRGPRRPGNRNRPFQDALAAARRFAGTARSAARSRESPATGRSHGGNDD